MVSFTLYYLCVYKGGVGPTSVRADEHQQSNVSRTPPADLMKSDQRGTYC